jgi:Kef-type K+ transport system membrane component KefB
VVGEILAGILLGPSLLGWLAPSAFASLFPPNRLVPLYFLSQIGLLLFMFTVGLELDVHALRKLGPAVVLTSNVSILAPLVAGAGLAVYLHSRLSSAGVSVPVFAFFIGTAMSITAFPVLARILAERDLLQTKVGMVAISCAAVDDITAWCLLALLIAKVRSGAGPPLWLTLAGLGGYFMLMVWVVRPLLVRLDTFRQNVSRETLAFTLFFVFLSAWTTERIGIHALFGAFFAGVILPKSENLARSMNNKLEMVTSVFLLPLFFALTGLRTSIHLLNGARPWFYCALIILVAILGKLLGCAISARVSGMAWRDALSVGILMNTRGLIELVILNVGLDLGVITPTLFSMMVIMALVTTFMTTPLLRLVTPAPILAQPDIGRTEG